VVPLVARAQKGRADVIRVVVDQKEWDLHSGMALST
jgi:hypothetical protein